VKAGTITVNCGVEYEPGYWFFWWSRPTYTAWADVDATGVEITKVQISTDGKNYRNGCCFTSGRRITEFFVKVTTKDGDKVWQYKNGKTSRVIDTITFKIDATTYEAQKDMTWEDWVKDTTYNKDGFKITGTCVYTSDDNYVVAVKEADVVRATDKIVAQNYVTVDARV